MRRLILVSALVLAGCDSGPQWENEQDELANDLNATAPVADDTNILSDTDYVNETSSAANDANAVASATNETAPPPQD